MNHISMAVTRFAGLQHGRIPFFPGVELWPVVHPSGTIQVSIFQSEIHNTSSVGDRRRVLMFIRYVKNRRSVNLWM
jgi:hypothetical protein